MQKEVVDGKVDSCLLQILMVCPRLAVRLDMLMFKSLLMNLSSLAVITLCTSMIFYLIPLIFFQIKLYSHLYYYQNAICARQFRHTYAIVTSLLLKHPDFAEGLADKHWVNYLQWIDRHKGNEYREQSGSQSDPRRSTCGCSLMRLLNS